MELAFVLLAEARLPSAEAITVAFRRFSTAEGQTLQVQESEGETLVFDLLPAGTAFVALMPVAVPNGEADAATRFSVSALGTGWKLPAHSAHLIVTLRDPGAASATEKLLRFTPLVAAVTEASGAVGVYWGGAGATHDPEFVTSIAEERDINSHLMLWTGVSVAREADGRLSCLSTGMRQLNLPDLLLIASPSAGNSALGTFFELLGYVVERGSPVPDGDTVGRTADERLPVHYVPSPIDPNVNVWRVELK